MSELKTQFDILPITFGKVEASENENDNASFISVCDVTIEQFIQYTQKLEAEGFLLFEKRTVGDNCFYAFKNGKNAVYISYYPSISEMRIVTELDSTYIDYSDNAGTKICPTTVTQINLEDFGISYVIQLLDGRFIIIDGGWHWEIEADKLMNCLKERTGGKKPVIAAWFLSHPHCDHYWCFVTFYEKYKNDVMIEKILFNFPSVTEEYIEKMKSAAFQVNGGKDNVDFMTRLYKYAEESGADVYCPHSGQSYQIGNAFCEILSSPDDTLRYPTIDGNPLSLIIKMTVEGQTIIWFTDGYFEPAKLVERYGSYLKSDIMQLPHHGFVGGTVEGYNAVDPKVCFASTFDCDMLAKMNIHKEDNRHLLNNLNVEEFLCGRKYSNENITITLPYEPSKNGRKKLDEAIKDGLGSLGARVWYFDGLEVDDDKDCIINIINPASGSRTVYIDLIFDNGADYIEEIKVEVSSYQRKSFNLSRLNLDENNPVHFERVNKKHTEIKKGVKFCAKVCCLTPIVVTSDSGKEAYHY